MKEKNKVKSKLQIKLESEGWRLLTNESVDRENIEEVTRLQKDYLSKGFLSVKLGDAYDISGNFIPRYRSVYVKR